MAMPQGCYLAKGAKRPSHTTNTIKFDRIPFDPCNSIKSITTQARHDCEKIAITGLEPASQDRSS